MRNMCIWHPIFLFFMEKREKYKKIKGVEKNDLKYTRRVGNT